MRGVLFAVQLAFVLVGVVTTVQFLRNRTRPQLEIALLFGSIALVVGVGWLAPRLDNHPALAVFSGTLLMAHPYLLLRVVKQVLPVRRWLDTGALIGVVASGLILAVFPEPRNVIVTVALIVFFVALECYDVVVIMRGVGRLSGVNRRRLLLAAIGAATFAGLILMAGIGTLLPDLPVWEPLSAGLVVVMVIAFYLGFACPRWLRRYWQTMELRRFLSESAQYTEPDSAALLNGLLGALIRSCAGNAGLAAMRREAQSGFVVVVAQGLDRMRGGVFELPASGVAAHCWRTGKPLFMDDHNELSVPELDILRAANARTLLALPVGSRERAWGIMVVAVPTPPLFPGDDLAMAQLISTQGRQLFDIDTYLRRQSQLHEELRRAHDHLEDQVRSRTRELAQRNVELERSNRELEQFAYIASHDLQEPLRTVAGFAQLLQRRGGDADATTVRYFEEIVVGTKRMQTLVNNLLEYSRVATQAAPLTKIDSSAAVHDALDALQALIEESEATLVVGSLPVVLATPGELVRVFQNLISNALKFRAADRPLRVHVNAERESENGHWRFVIEDNGIGFDQAFAERIFGIFQRLHARHEYPGTGIGLALCLRIVQHMGGQIWAESDEGTGSRFYFTLRDGEHDVGGTRAGAATPSSSAIQLAVRERVRAAAPAGHGSERIVI